MSAFILGAFVGLGYWYGISGGSLKKEQGILIQLDQYPLCWVSASGVDTCAYACGCGAGVKSALCMSPVSVNLVC
ncbi:MAG: hypothetical protein RR250_07905, partial [Akkermansia sp.]